MPNISINCPHCNYALRVPAEWNGQTVACPGCRRSVAIPLLSQLKEVGITQQPQVEQQSAPRAVPVDAVSSVAVPAEAVPVAVEPIQSFKDKFANFLKTPNFKIGLGVAFALFLIIIGICMLLFFRHFRMCGENMQKYADALQRFEIANARAPWDLLQFEKYIGEMPPCPAHKTCKSYQFAPAGQHQVKREMSNASEIPVLVCVHGFRAQVLYADGHVDIVKGWKNVKELLKPIEAVH